MIDLKTFAAKMTILADRFGRTKLLDETLAMYFDALNQKLSTAEFVEACRVIFEQDTYWPSPRRFVEAVKGDPKAEAEALWDRVLKLSTRSADEQRSGWAVLPPAVRDAVTDLGGLRDVGLASESRLRAMRGQFLRDLAPEPSPGRVALPGVAELAR